MKPRYEVVWLCERHAQERFAQWQAEEAAKADKAERWAYVVVAIVLVVLAYLAWRWA